MAGWYRRGTDSKLDGYQPTTGAGNDGGGDVHFDETDSALKKVSVCEVRDQMQGILIELKSVKCYKGARQEVGLLTTEVADATRGSNIPGKGKTMSIANIIDVHMIKEALHDGGQGEVVTML